MSDEKILSYEELAPYLTLKKVSEILDIPTSTLRYWDKLGLVRFERHWQNDYRQVSPKILSRLVDVAAFREMQIPIEQVKQTEQMPLAALQNLLGQTKNTLKDQIAGLRQTIKKIELREKLLRRLQQLTNEKTPGLRDCRLPAIYQVDLQDTEDMKRYLTPFYAADLVNPNDLDDWRVAMFAESARGHLLRAADDNPKPYLNGLLWFEVNDETQNNLAMIVSTAEKMGYKITEVICQWLVTCLDEEQRLCEFFEFWASVEKPA